MLSAEVILAWTTERLAKGADSEALAALAEAVARFPADSGIAVRHADALHLAGQLAPAAAAYRRALLLDPAAVDGWNGLGCVELARGAFGETVRCLREALALQPGRLDIRFNLGKALFDLGEVDAAVDCYRAVVAAGPSALAQGARAALAAIIPGAASADNAAVLRVRRDWARKEAKALGLAGRFRPAPAAIGGKLRIGYVSAFFGDRNWMKPVWAAVNHHDRARFEIHFFHDVKPPSTESGYRDHADDVVHDVRGATNEGLASYVARCGIDILVDLNGYSHPSRLDLFMRRPAPVIVGWFNMFATTGIDAFDYIIGDDAVIPAAEERFYSERVRRVPGSYLAFNVLYPVPDVEPPPVLATGSLTFGCFASQYKLTEATVAIFAAILQGAPQARLLLKSRPLADESNRSAVRARFARHGVASERVLMEGPDEHFAFLAAYARVDIALDPFPYSGGTTTMEALWQGVPVLTFNGDRWASRTSRSLLLAAGLEEWCLADRDALIRRTIALAVSPTTPSALAALRTSLRDRIAKTAACDGAALCRGLETLYEEIAIREGRRSGEPL
ncbi:MAG TPA: tetratricopeptide repeat protein [Methylomirabilota bacterium]|nr:tetratricopeptide repeat protein [Methylomirabilota bacterium]